MKVEENRRKIANEYKYQIESHKQMLKNQMEKMAGQNSIIKKLSEQIVDNENTIMNVRFLFYKLIHKDTFGVTIMPPKGTGFELLNKNLLHDSVDQIGNNLLKQSKRLNINLMGMLERSNEAIKLNYFNYIDKVDELEHTAPLKDIFELERVEYNQQIKAMQEMVKETAEMSAVLLQDAN